MTLNVLTETRCHQITQDSNSNFDFKRERENGTERCAYLALLWLPRVLSGRVLENGVHWLNAAAEQNGLDASQLNTLPTTYENNRHLVK